MPEVIFRSVYPWAILPRKIKIDVRAKEEEVRLMEENFRFVRFSRSAELCWPWRLAQEMGWVIDSPVTVAMDALHDVEASCTPADSRTANLRTNCTEVHEFQREGTAYRAHFTRNAGWLRLYDFRAGDHDEPMFYANGEGSVEWIMGWMAMIPPTHFLMLMPYAPIPNLEVIFGVLNAKNLRRPGKSGLSIAVRPTGPVKLLRGQPIARIILLHPDSLHATARIEDAAAPALDASSGAQEAQGSQ